MPLTERDINTHREGRRNKRHSIQQDISYSRLNDENTPSPAVRGKTTKTTPLSERLLAPTKSSAAKAAATTPRTPGLTTPQPRVNSKLPRRTTPNTAPSGTAKAASRPGSTSDTGEVTRDKVAAAGRTRLRQPTSRPGSQTDKPLPPRPVVSLTTTLSPTKDSRTLVDAIEKPLQQSVDEGLRDWPAMIPRPFNDMSTEVAMTYELEASQSSPMAATSPDIFSPDRSDTGVPHSLVNRSLSACDDHETASDRSSSTTFLSAEDGNVLASAYNGDENHTLQRPSNSTEKMMHDDCNKSSPLGDGQVSHPRRDASLPALPAQYPHDLTTNSSFDRELSAVDHSIVMPNTLGCFTDSRPHSPSPASFSRPRPSSISHGRGLPSPNTTATNAAKVLRAQKTASRIPIPDPKKAMLVDVKSRTSAATQKSDHAPSFGSRRLDAPDTLKILNQGIKRRQMNQPKRANTSHSTATTETSSTHTYVQSEYPAVDRSKTNTPENTFGNSSSDEEEIVTPTYQVDFGNTGHQDKLIDGHRNSYYHNAAVRLFDGAVSALGRTPPPTSPYTDPLQTIQSQIVLPTQDEGGTLLSVSAHSRKPSDLKTLNKRLSELHNAHADYTAARIGDRARVPESIKYSLLELLNEYTNEDRHLSKEGHAGLDAETKKHITRTLSMLEGNGTPAHTDVDNETLLRLFGHLKRGLEKQPGSVSFADNAAAAEQFLAQPTGDAVESYDPINATAAFCCPIVAHEANEHAANVRSDLSSTEAVASKWSESTASIDASCPSSDHTPPGQKYAASRAEYAAPQRAPPEPPRSIGYPSRIASKANTLIGPGGSGPATPPAPIRLSSPTLGKSKPGSVRAARETMKGGFARTTASADSKKTSKLPSPSAKSLQLHEGGQRGRGPSAEKPRTQSDTPVAPKTRSRSKSRYVMDKINGLFSSKRDKRGSAMSPIPSIAELDAMPDLNIDNTSDVSLVPRSARGPTGTKMPTMSPILERAAIDTSRLDTPTSVNTPVDSVLAGDDGNQALQNWTATLVNKAAREQDPVRKERLVSFAKVLNDSLISAREAQISAETAQHAAKSAQLSYEMTQQSVAMLQRLAASLTTRGPRR
ncbi:hypothetical protein LTR17_013449 [Elasticomyces elasticus]|nr:hypothetical protein LTR17_013449 [Elasticomyces elasticus]